MMNRMLLIYLCCITYSLTAQQAPIAFTFVDTNTNYIGDLFPLEIIALVPAEQVVFPPAELLFQGAEQMELVEELAVESTQENDYYRYTKRYLLRVWEPGRYPIPAVDVYVPFQGDTLQFSTSKVFISVLAPQITGDSSYVADIKPILQEDAGFWDSLKAIVLHPLFLIIFLVFVLGIIYLLIQRKNVRSSIVLSPEQQALADLHALIQSEYMIQADYLKVYSQISYILRNFLNKRFQIKTLQNPWIYDIDKLKKNNLLSASNYDFLIGVLLRSERIKFAKACPLEGVSQQDVQQSIVLIEQIEQAIFNKDNNDESR